MEIEERLAKTEKCLEELKEGWVLVEGLKDKSALEKLGIGKILTISGNLKISCEKLACEHESEKVYVLTDLDRRGDEQAKRAIEVLESHSIRGDLEMRKRLAFLLRIKFFEDALRAYHQIKEEGEKHGKNIH